MILLCLLLARSVAALNLGACDAALSVVPGHPVEVVAPQILIRGLVRFGRVAGRVGFYVDDLDVDHRAAADDGEGRHALREHDRVYLLNAARDRVIGAGVFHERPRLARWSAGGTNGVLNVPEPTLRDLHGRVAIDAAALRDLVGREVAAVVVRTLAPAEFGALRLRTTVLDARARALRAEPERVVRVTAEVTHVLRAGEVAAEGALALGYESIALPAIDWRRGILEIAKPAVITRLSFGDETRGYRSIARGDQVYFVDADDHLLMRWNAAGVEFTTAPPFSPADLAFARMLGRARRVVVVRRN